MIHEQYSHIFGIKTIIDKELFFVEYSTKKLISEHIYRYVLGLEKCKILKQLASNFRITTKVLKIKKKLDNSHYCLSRLWRAVYSNILYGTDYSILVDNYNIDIKDLEESIKVVYPTDLSIINNRKNSLNIPLDNNQEIVSKLINYIRSRVYKKLYFIYKYQNLDAEDFVSDIITSIIRTLTKVDYIDNNTTKIIISKRIIKQEIANIINKFTTTKRSRLIKDSRGYRSKNLSLDSCFSFTNENQPYNLYNILKYNNNNFLAANMLRKIRNRVSKEEKLFIDIKVGKIKIPATFTSTSKDLYNYLGWNDKKINTFKNKVLNIIDN